MLEAGPTKDSIKGPQTAHNT